MKKKKIPTLSENCKEYLTAWEFVFIFYARILRWLLCKIGNLLIYSPQITEIFMEIKDEKNEKNEKVLFPVWEYHPLYLPDFLKIQVADGTPLSEPMFFYLSFADRQDKYPAEKKENMKHSLPLKEVTNIEVHINQKNEFSEAAKIINNIDNLLLIKDNENYLKLTFDKGAYKKEKDFRPNIPLIINW